MRTAAVLLAVLLAACSTAPPRRAGPPPQAGAAPPQMPASVAERGIAPPPPADLDAIPDAVPRLEPRSNRGNPLSYEVFGKRYVLLASAEGYRERGVASWYGPDFHARPTSSGEPYDMYAMTAAHKTLPIPAYARVTNLANGRSVVVRINDRGPFVANRIIDLSYTAAHKLDMTRAGTAFVEVEVITPGSLPDLARGLAPQPQPTLASTAMYLQAGAFGVAANAEQLARRLRAAGVAGVTIREPDAAVSLYRVRVGPVADVATFDLLAAQMARLGVGTVLVTE
ncbi:MAG: septal ring lytic transglycosylase RlpA family protein [Steroidobacteraceae bacterium]